MIIVEIMYHKEKYPNLPEVKSYGNFIDLYSAKDYEYKAGDFFLIDLGVSIKLPNGYWGQLVPRSSAFKNFGIIQTNSFGVIDTSYCGKDDIWMMPAYAIRDGKINANDRVCQFRIVKDIPMNLLEVDHLDDINRGGFGSTGRN